MSFSFERLSDFKDHLRGAPPPFGDAHAAARERNGQLTKPPGALGRLEDLALWYASWQGSARPSIDNPQIIVFAGNHGIAAQGVSAFPADVTQQMVANFHHGGAAINQIARVVGARLDVRSLSLDQPTNDFSKGDAMSEAECLSALNVGWDAVDDEADLLVVGEMGIGNTTSAAAMSAALFGGPVTDWVGRGTGIDDASLALKQRVVEVALARHRASTGDPLEILRCLGGRELAAMAGAIARARMMRVPVILDGFICSAAAASIECAVPGSLAHAEAGHMSAETAHKMLLEKLKMRPILSLEMRLGEASGGALAIGILRGAVACHSGMATFEEMAAMVAASQAR